MSFERSVWAEVDEHLFVPQVRVQVQRSNSQVASRPACWVRKAGCALVSTGCRFGAMHAADDSMRRSARPRRKPGDWWSGDKPTAVSDDGLPIPRRRVVLKRPRSPVRGGCASASAVLPDPSGIPCAKRRTVGAIADLGRRRTRNDGAIDTEEHLMPGELSANMEVILPARRNVNIANGQDQRNIYGSTNVRVAPSTSLSGDKNDDDEDDVANDDCNSHRATIGYPYVARRKLHRGGNRTREEGAQPRAVDMETSATGPVAPSTPGSTPDEGDGSNNGRGSGNRADFVEDYNESGAGPSLARATDLQFQSVQATEGHVAVALAVCVNSSYSGEMKVPPRTNTGAQRALKSDEFFLVVAGRVYLDVSNQRYILNTGDHIVIPHLACYSFNNVSSTECRLVFFVPCNPFG
jgi:quercetin dioxygenase-like cupin family protein